MVPHMLLGIHWILENKDRYNIRILNISIGTKEEEQYGEESALVKGVEEAWDQGIVVIAAAANNGPGEGTIGSPGISRKIITVGSTEGEIRRSRKGMRRYLYSGCGPTRGCVVKPDLLAPGSRIISCGNTRQGYVTKSGTSMSTPMVSGAAALLLQKHPELTNKEVKERLWECGDDLHLPLTVQGRGRLNIRALLCPESGE